MQYLYVSDNQYHVMDMETYEQLFLTEEQLGTSKNYLQENVVVKVVVLQWTTYRSRRPDFVELRIAKTDPGVRGDTASGGTKPATLETGATVHVSVVF